MSFFPQIQRRAAKIFICEISMGNRIGYNGSNLPLRLYAQICSLIRLISRKHALDPLLTVVFFQIKKSITSLEIIQNIQGSKMDITINIALARDGQSGPGPGPGTKIFFDWDQHQNFFWTGPGPKCFFGPGPWPKYFWLGPAPKFVSEGTGTET